MTALGLLLSLSLLVVMSVREVRRVGADEVGTTRGGWLLRAELLLIAGVRGPGAAAGHRAADVSGSRIWWMVSDLHLRTGGDRRGTGEALVELLDAIADTAPEADRHLVLLGDTLRPAR